jgi:hypothetical protein
MTTMLGDTGLWFLPIAEVAVRGGWAASAYRTDADFNPGSTDVSHLCVGVDVGVAQNVELFGTWFAQTRIDRDEEPLFTLVDPGPRGGIVNEFPLVSAAWAKGRGDLIVGGKINLRSQADGHAIALAVRPTLKIPTGKSADGLSTGRFDISIVAVASREVSQRVEWTLTSGYIARGDPDGIDLKDGILWGAGVMGPTRRTLRASLEVYGERYVGSAVRVSAGRLPATAHSIDVPMSSPQASPVNVNVGINWLGRSGLFLGGAVQVNLNQKDVAFGSKIGLQARVGVHPGVVLRR